MATDTRNRILSVAARLFEAHGFEGTAVASILREADVNSGSLYHFFPSKDALLVAVLEKYVDTLEPGLLEAAGRAADDPVEKVFALLELYRGRLLVSRFTRGCPVGDLSLEVGNRIPEAAPPIRLYFERWAERVESWLTEAGRRLPDPLDRRALAEHFLSTLEGAVMQARAVGAIAPFDHSVDQLRALVDLLSSGEGAYAGSVQRVPNRRPVVEIAPSAPEADSGSVAAGDAAWWRAW
jgi:AcrR family transcriptional regulator